MGRTREEEQVQTRLKDPPVAVLYIAAAGRCRPRSASSWDAPRPHVHPRSGREPAYTQPEHGKFSLGQMEMALGLPTIWLIYLHHCLCPLLGEPGGVRTKSLGVPG